MYSTTWSGTPFCFNSTSLEAGSGYTERDTSIFSIIASAGTPSLAIATISSTAICCLFGIPAQPTDRQTQPSKATRISLRYCPGRQLNAFMVAPSALSYQTTLLSHHPARLARPDIILILPLQNVDHAASIAYSHFCRVRRTATRDSERRPTSAS